MEVARDGSVTAQGERITQIYVDGKPFFGSDPRMATQNLPADIIDKIQLVDKKSEQSRVTRVEDGVVEKVINIMVGDLQRIRIYPEKGFQIYQEMPEEVWNAAEKLMKAGFTDCLVKNFIT